MADSVMQHSFAGGEMSPSLLARTDLTKYRSGAATMRNWFVDYRSGTSTRFGLEFINQTKYNDRSTRLIPFQFSVDINYVIEFGDFYCRFYFKGDSILNPPVAISAISNTNPVVVTIPGHTYTVGTWLFIKDVGGMLAMNNRYFIVTSVAGNDVTLSDTSGVPVNSTTYDAYTSGGTSGSVYEIASQYAYQDLHLIKFVQLKNVMTLVHPKYPVTKLTATGPTNWTFTQVSFGTKLPAPLNLTAEASATGNANYSYVVTAVDENGTESLASSPGAAIGAVNIQVTAGSISLSWTPVNGAVSYNVYKASISLKNPVPAGAAYGFIQSATGNILIDSNIVPDFSQTPPIIKKPFESPGNYPGVTCFFQQRAYYAASTNFPTTFWASQPGSYDNFNVSDPIIDSDSISGTLVSLQLNEIKSMLPMPGGLVILTSGGAWQLSSGQGGLASTAAVTPTNATATPQAYNGASDVPPIVVNYDVLYVQSKGSIVRDLSYNIYANIYTGADISVISNHLFFAKQILEWAYSEEPFKIIWSVRNDGILLSLTFVREQEIIGWARHDTEGLFKSVCAIREFDHDVPYFVVKRLMNGKWVQSVERMADRVMVYGAEDAFCADCGIRSVLPEPQATIEADSDIGAVTFVTDVPVFTSDDVGKVLRMGGGIADITQYNSPTVIEGEWRQSPTVLVPNMAQEIPVPAEPGDWTLAKPAQTFYGLDYLEGMKVAILADGIVVPKQTVVGGKITINFPATKVVVGLSYQCQLQTMYLDTGEPTIQGKRKAMPQLTIRARETRGIKAGRTWDSVVPVKQFMPSVKLGQPIPLENDDAFFNMDPLWDVPGQICIVQDDPLPATILGVIPEVVIGDSSGRLSSSQAAQQQRGTLVR